MHRPAFVGVDNGGTWIRFKGLDTSGRCVWALQKPSPSVEDLPRFLKKHLRRFGGPLDGLAVGSRGVWKQTKRQTLKRALKGLAKNIVVISDVEAAWLASFRQEGILVISGTGSIAFGRKANGTIARAGGLGPDLGDEGSGYWIAKEWLLRTGQDAKASQTVRNVAAFAPHVLALAKRHDPLATAIVEQAQLELAALVRDLVNRLGLQMICVSGAGSVLGDRWFSNGFFDALLPQQVLRVEPKTDAATALARSIMSRASR